MLLKFKNIVIHNFLSLGDVKLELNNLGNVLIEGVNKNSKDAAISNGSGKSSIFNAICWALTGETIQGVTSNIVNIYGEDGCFVELEFSIDNDDFIITRTRDYCKKGSDLKVIRNDKDISGKGIRESTKVLSDYLCDLNGELLGNVILLGQGLPNRFSSNTPSGRKELLEKLSKSDYMIEDLKLRLNTRKDELNGLITDAKNNILLKKNLVEIYKSSIDDATKKLNELYSNPLDEAYRDNLVEEIGELETTKIDINQELSKINKQLNDAMTNLTNLSECRDNLINDVTSKFQLLIDAAEKDISDVRVQVQVIDAELSRLNSIMDICPTCGQKLIGIKKPDSTKVKIQLENLKSELEIKLGKLEDLNISKQKELDKINSSYNLTELKEFIAAAQNTIQTYNNNLMGVESNLTRLNGLLTSMETEYQLYLNNIKQLEDTISLNVERQKQTEDEVVYYTEEEYKLSQHLDVINQMLTVVKRDFRGYLLKGVIEFIDHTMNNYSQTVFGDRYLKFELEGNNINILYQDKPYENLSGGEKQKVDLIIQFSIRDMLSRYLNFYCNILVLDEIFDNLDLAGCQNILNLITNLSDLDSTFIISHHADELQIPYDKKITVVKDDFGISRIVV